MFRLKKSIVFEASHQLPYHDGKCRNLHGHSWKLTLVVEASGLVESGPKSGMAADYGDIGVVCKQLHDYYDHKHLNDIFPNPTSEVIAKAAYDFAKPLIERLGVKLCAVCIGETCTTECEYTE